MFTSALKMFLNSSVVTAVTDAYFNLVTLLLPGNGTNGAQNNTFLDSSSNNFTITRNGNTTQGTFSPFSQTGWSNYFDGTGDYLTVPNNAAFNLSTNDFTLELFWYPTTFQAGSLIESASASNYAFAIYAQSSGAVQFYAGTGASASWNILSAVAMGTATLNAWNHIVVVRSGTTFSYYLNGTRTGQSTSVSSAIGQQAIGIGANSVGSSVTGPGYISNLRLVNGAALYSGTTLTVPTAPLTTTSQGATASQVELLTCQSNRFIDNSDNAFTITRNGDTSVQAFSPFVPTAAYSAATVGGSGYFDGTGDNLAVPTDSANSVGSGSFYFEAWVYLTNPSVAQMIIADPSNTGGLFVGLNIDGGSRFTIGRTAVGVDNLVTVTWVGNQWYHLAVNRNGTSLQFFVNGTQVGSTGTNSVNYPSVGYRVGAEQAAGSSPLTGYISGLRLVKSSVNTTNFTPPTAPPDASTAALCLQFTNAGITDATAKNVLETVGNASISTAQSKFGGSSMLFDGTGDYLSATPKIQSNAVQGGNATIEMWVYTSNSSPSLKCLVDTRSAQNTDTGFGVYQISNNVVIYGAGVKGNAVGQLTGNTWVHVAVTRANTTNYVFIDGTLYNTFSYGNTLTSSNVTIGSDVAGSNAFTGYIDDLRITNGFARYTANFTPTTVAFPLQ